MNRYDFIEDDEKVYRLLDELDLVVYTNKPRAVSQGFARLVSSITTKKGSADVIDKCGTRTVKEVPNKVSLIDELSNMEC